MVRRRLLHTALLLAVSGLSSGPATSAPLESVWMPYACSIDGARVLLTPSEPRGHPIVGRREERQITTCTAPAGVYCRTLMAHRFAVSCGGRAVPWMRVVAAASSASTRTLWIENGRMHLALDKRAPRSSRCDDGSRRYIGRQIGEGAGGRFGLPLVECLPWERSRGTAHVVLPPGFAPLGEIGARIEIGGPAAGPVAAHGPAQRPSAQIADAGGNAAIAATGIAAHPVPNQSPAASKAGAPTATAPGSATAPVATIPPSSATTPVSTTTEGLAIAAGLVLRADASAPESSNAVASRHITVETLPEVAAIPVVLTGADASRTWITLVRPEPASEQATLKMRSIASWLVAGMLAALLAAWAIVMWRSERAPSRRPAGGSLRAAWAALGRRRLRETLNTVAGASAPQPPAETSVVNAAASVSALIDQTRGSLQDLSNAAPLRDVLDQEIALIRQRLAIVKAQASEGPEAAHKAAPAFRTLVRDLERLRRISESAALSFSGNRVAVTLPRTRGEAFGVLGINADVEEATLKRLVDALRICWHPDLGKSDADRAEREERIKSINVAWDLITGKRTAT